MVILLVSVKYIAIPFPPESCLRSQSAPGWVLDGRFASGANRLVRPEIDRPAAGSFRNCGSARLGVRLAFPPPQLPSAFRVQL